MDIITRAKSSVLSSALRFREQIDFAVIGFPKCGTTSIHANLMSSGSIYMPDYEVQIKNYIKGDVGFEGDAPIKGIKNPNLIYEPHNWMALCRANPEVKFILGLRNPTAWLFSFYQYRKKEINQGKAWLAERIDKSPRISEISFKDIVYGNENIVGASLAHGKFVNWLEPLAKYVPRDNVFLFFVEELAEHPDRVYQSMSNFLGVDYNPVDPPIEANRHARTYEDKQVYKAELDYLNQYYSEWNKSLNKLLINEWGVRNDWW